MRADAFRHRADAVAWRVASLLEAGDVSEAAAGVVWATNAARPNRRWKYEHHVGGFYRAHLQRPI